MDEQDWKREKYRTGRLLRQVLEEIQSERFDSAKVTLADLLGDESGRRAMVSALRSAAPQRAETEDDTQEIGGPAASRVLRGYIDVATNDHAIVDDPPRAPRPAPAAPQPDPTIDPHAFDDLIVTRSDGSASTPTTSQFPNTAAPIHVDADRLVRVRAQVAEMLSELEQRPALPPAPTPPAPDPMRERMRSALQSAERAVTSFETQSRAAVPPPPAPPVGDAMQTAFAQAGLDPQALRVLRGVLDQLATQAATPTAAPAGATAEPPAAPAPEPGPARRHAPGAAIMRQPRRRET